MIHNIPDLVSAGAGAVPLIAGSVRTPANWVQVTALPGNNADVRFGDSTTSATSGARISPGAGQTFPATSNAESLDLSQCYIYFAGASDTVSIVYGKT